MSDATEQHTPAVDVQGNAAGHVADGSDPAYEDQPQGDTGESLGGADP